MLDCPGSSEVDPSRVLVKECGRDTRKSDSCEELTLLAGELLELEQHQARQVSQSQKGK